MTDGQILLIIIGICITILVLIMITKKSYILTKIIIKSCIGIIGIYIINDILSSLQIYISLGINYITVLTTGLLGAPGFIMLYIIVIYDYFY